MKNILFTKLLGEPEIIESDGFSVMRGNKKMDGGKDIIAHCDTRQEAEELVSQLKEIEEGSGAERVEQ